MIQEIIRHKKLTLFQWWIIFIILFMAVVSITEIIEIIGKYEINRIIDFFIVLYLYIFIFLYWQMHYYQYEIIDGHLVIKEFLGKKEKYTLIIPFSHIISLSMQSSKTVSKYHKKKTCKKHWMVGYNVYFIEYDDYMDVSLLEFQCSHEFIQSLNRHI
ncbi:hypothetical protein QBE53_00050 [Vallitaleaceae bacterium 9-2]